MLFLFLQSKSPVHFCTEPLLYSRISISPVYIPHCLRFFMIIICTEINSIHICSKHLFIKNKYYIIRIFLYFFLFLHNNAPCCVSPRIAAVISFLILRYFKEILQHLFYLFHRYSPFLIYLRII